MVQRIMEEKICVICHRSFTWRKRWRRCWDEVLYCSAACRKQKRSARNPTDARS
ncbi:DUF2256 domain-containing protein [Acidithiobacillus montserratensis]|uniref:DUF2256 domain-containing protein n=1 Tax=Acidithiobacillus montserratensis TaxID=2729135 RepID=UPI001C0612C6|nr:DUF2256 domain-containing protein [Acidithiobacillaceae bacterium]MBU2747175.1 DUF2256 domain-containing protein [Acidithiobacillus montserratensis]